MGEHTIHRAADETEARAFTRSVVQDIRALEALIARDGVETGITRMGAEQEMYLVGADYRPAPIAHELLARINDARFTTELARFNLEANFEPQLLAGDFLKRLQADLESALRTVSAAAHDLDARVLLTGILPTLRVEDLGVSNLSPELRYQYLNEALFRGRDAITVVIDGIDQYAGTYDSVILEGANTSLQLHLQVDPAASANLYNLMQLITAPLLAAATNSPVLLGRRLWHETRVAVFERSLDERTGAQLVRGFPTRVSFGDAWIKESVVEIFRDNAARYPVILTRDLEEDSPAMVAAGQTPQFAALTLHNGTVWRWNRPCYGITDGVAHLRIENRVLPAGPTVVDEVANAALFYGMMAALPAAYGDVAERLPFDDARVNFLGAAREGLAAEFNWLDGRRIASRALLLEELIPAARNGLASLAVPAAQIDYYLGIMEARVTSLQTGSNWLLNTFQAHRDREPHAVWCDAGKALKAELYNCFVSQRGLLGTFPIDVERFRLPPRYDFTQIPDVPEILYDQYELGTSSAEWLELTRAASETLKLEAATPKLGRSVPPAVGQVNFGDLARNEPISRVFGYDRGTPIDRPFIEIFLDQHRQDIRGRVLEVGDDSYTRRFGGERVIRSDVLHVREGAPGATIIADLSYAPQIPDDSFDCLILTQVLELIFDLTATMATIHRILKPAGTALITVPGISNIETGEGDDDWMWGFTPNSLRQLLLLHFPRERIQVSSRGNVFTTISFLHGLCVEDLRSFPGAEDDPCYPQTVLARAVK